MSKRAEGFRVMIATAGFGDGHNSAARGVAEALQERGVVTEVVDPCDLGAPRLNEKLKGFYRFVTTYLPKVWYGIYRGTDRQDFNKKKMLPFMRALEGALADEVERFNPDVLVSTYPLYPYSYQHLLNENRVKKMPVVTVVTDSIQINGTWLNAPSDEWLVTDELTRGVLLGEGLSSERVKVTGFPVSTRFEKLSPVRVDKDLRRLRVLLFLTARKAAVRGVGRQLLKDERVEVTFVLGRNVRKLYWRVKRLKKKYPERVRIKGWTRQVPELISQHDLLIGKAGGATTHEAIAGQCPMWVHHVVPGQEEGNLRLLEQLGVGAQVTKKEDLAQMVDELLANDGTKWRAMKKRLADLSQDSGAAQVAEHVLSASLSRVAE